LARLIRGGNLYLTAKDAVALALENNIDVESARYNPIASDWRVTRALAGGALPGVPSAPARQHHCQRPGRAGESAAAGVSGGGGVNAGRGSTNATVSQVGPVTQTLDPTIQEATTFSHRSNPQSNVTQSLTTNLIQNQRVYTGSYRTVFLPAAT